MRMRVRSGWPSKSMPNMSYTSRSGASVPGHRSNNDGKRGVVLGHLDPDRERGRSRLLTTKDTSNRSGAMPAGSGRPGWRGSRRRSGRRTGDTRRRGGPAQVEVLLAARVHHPLTQARRHRAAVHERRRQPPRPAASASSRSGVGHAASGSATDPDCLGPDGWVVRSVRQRGPRHRPRSAARRLRISPFRMFVRNVSIEWISVSGVGGSQARTRRRARSGRRLGRSRSC